MTPIGVVVDHFGIPLSTLHYWERRGLLTAHRRAGRRCYDRDQLYRISLIQHWQATGLMNLDEIAELLTARAGDPEPQPWHATVTARITAIDDRIAELTTARGYLTQLMGCRCGHELERCSDYRAAVTLPAPDMAVPR
ncbi:MerR family transcriptional regulator [Pseudonocardia acaciae]|uniref:MerR family transcriptional regulator n=1 Tax=Pseudonocardia acaciae TaxID=551276 RepID=UPI00048D7FF5|nr:MerR family transcriptional regulator [Pseudonocardia acaciae]